MPATDVFAVSHATPLSVQAADILRAQILRGHFEPGQRINEVEVANSLGISRSPLREGLRTLAQEGLVRMASGRGVFGASFRAEEIGELLELRQALDVLAIELAARRATPTDLDKLEHSVEGLAAAHEPDGQAVPWASDFHLVIFEIAGNKKLREHGWIVHTQLRLARFRSGSADDRVQAAHAEHRAILAALRAHDAVEAERRVREHHEKGAAHILRTISASGYLTV
jgi:DNA-binding GntR family transcriptional regulator